MAHAAVGVATTCARGYARGRDARAAAYAATVAAFSSSGADGTEDGTSALIAPKATLPLEQYVYDAGTSNRVMCVTCHNPHGTDLFVFDEFGNGQIINDNNMLRLRDEDSTLCEACH